MPPSFLCDSPSGTCNPAAPGRAGFVWLLARWVRLVAGDAASRGPERRRTDYGWNGLQRKRWWACPRPYVVILTTTPLVFRMLKYISALILCAGLLANHCYAADFLTGQAAPPVLGQSTFKPQVTRGSSTP